MPPKPPADDDFFEPLTEEEVNFCWRCLVDQGQLSTGKLQTFYQEITGERLSAVQAKDLRNYMDADGNGVVGMEDFKNFMSICRLQDTDPKSFMWTPNHKWREEHPGGMKGEDDAAALERSLPQKAPAAPLRPASGEGASGAASSTAMEPKAPPGKRKGPARPAASPAPPRPAASPEVAVASSEKEEPLPGALDAKTIAHIEATIEKYEQESWAKFAEEEETFKKSLFAHFAGQDSEMSALQYHRMVTKWHGLTKWCLPCDVRPGDSLAALEYVLSKDRQARGESAPDGGSEAKLPYRVWQDLIKGKHRPEDHLTSKSGH
mmetsp:Transcript_19648/g.52154  ORF Transcript_19648/g.52154 Transcript_19648/m.52154 type:complete len:320 (+) Transcript_19648:107-1066(+)